MKSSLTTAGPSARMRLLNLRCEPAGAQRHRSGHAIAAATKAQDDKQRQTSIIMTVLAKVKPSQSKNRCGFFERLTNAVEQLSRLRLERRPSLRLARPLPQPTLRLPRYRPVLLHSLLPRCFQLLRQRLHQPRLLGTFGCGVRDVLRIDGPVPPCPQSQTGITQTYV